MKGGMESSGATSMDQRFFDSNISVGTSASSPDGIMSAYGPIDAKDVGSGLLAPFTASTSNTANPNTMMKTGGKKSVKKTVKKSVKKSVKKPVKKTVKKPVKKTVKKPVKKTVKKPVKNTVKKPVKKTVNKPVKKTTKKSMKGAGGIPEISASPVSSVQNTLGNAINGFNNFMQELNNDYLKSVKSLQTMKIGSQRLIQGGNKKKLQKKIQKKPKSKQISKPKSKKVKGKSKSKKMKGGFDGSDWASSLSSRGPAGTPDDYWGVNGETWFRQFNKTGEYIPNSQLPYAATPELAGRNPSGVVSGYEERIINNGVSNGV
jgi:hypothetical protein